MSLKVGCIFLHLESWQTSSSLRKHISAGWELIGILRLFTIERSWYTFGGNTSFHLESVTAGDWWKLLPVRATEHPVDIRPSQHPANKDIFTLSCPFVVLTDLLTKITTHSYFLIHTSRSVTDCKQRWPQPSFIQSLLKGLPPSGSRGPLACCLPTLIKNQIHGTLGTLSLPALIIFRTQPLYK